MIGDENDMASGIIKGDPVVSTTYTQNGFTIDCYKRGRICMITCSAGSASRTIGANQAIATIGTDYCPVQRLFLWNMTSSGGRLVLDTNGDLSSVAEITSGTILRFCTTYISLN